MPLLTEDSQEMTNMYSQGRIYCIWQNRQCRATKCIRSSLRTICTQL